MTPKQTRLVARCYPIIELKQNEIASSFYDRLFELEPETKKLFPQGMEEQKKKFMSIIKKFIDLQNRSSLSLPISGAGNSNEIVVSHWADLAERHKKYGAKVHHFRSAKNAFVLSLQENIGDQVDSETIEAWAEAFELISGSIAHQMSGQNTHPTMPSDHSRASVGSGEDFLNQLFSKR